MKISTEIYTSKADACEDFYCTHFNFAVKYKTEGFVILQHQTNPEYELMFCVPGSPFVHPVFHPEFNGMGVILQMAFGNPSRVQASIIILPMKGNNTIHQKIIRFVTG